MMSKKACKAGKKKRRKMAKKARFVCDKCGAEVPKGKNCCKPKKL